MAVKPCSNTLKIAPCSCGTRSTLAHSIGVKVSATNPEITTAPATAIPNSLNSRPVEPRRKPNGVNTATSARVVDRVRDEHGPIPRGFELHAGGQGLLDAGQGLANPACHLDEICLGLPDDADRDRGIPIVAEYRAIVLGPELDVRHVLEPDELPALACDHQLPEFPRRLQLAQ